MDNPPVDRGTHKTNRVSAKSTVNKDELPEIKMLRLKFRLHLTLIFTVFSLVSLFLTFFVASSNAYTEYAAGSVYVVGLFLFFSLLVLALFSYPFHVELLEEAGRI